MDYSKYTDAHIVEKTGKDKAEQALFDMRVDQAAEEFLDKYKARPTLRKAVAMKLAEYELAQARRDELPSDI